MAHLLAGHPLLASDFRGAEAPADKQGRFLSRGPRSASGTDGKACAWLGYDGSLPRGRPQVAVRKGPAGAPGGPRRRQAQPRSELSAGQLGRWRGGSGAAGAPWAPNHTWRTEARGSYRRGSGGHVGGGPAVVTLGSDSEETKSVSSGETHTLQSRTAPGSGRVPMDRIILNDLRNDEHLCKETSLLWEKRTYLFIYF